MQDDEQRTVELASALADDLPVGFILRWLDPPRPIYANPAFYELSGMSPDDPEPPAVRARRQMHPDDLAAFADLMASTERGRSAEKVVRIRRRADDEGYRWIRFRMSPVRRPPGAPGQVVTIAEDVTEVQETLARLHESESRLAQFADSVQVGISLRQIDPPAFLYVNPAFIALMGEDPTEPGVDVEAAVASLASLVHPDDREGALARYWTRASQGLPAVSEHRIVLPGGDVRWMRVTSTPVVDGSGVVNRAASTMEDITDRMSAELAARDAQHAAEEANAAKDEFLSRMSHELRTPLNAVLGFAQLLYRDDLSADQHEAVGHIVQGGRHLLGMINDILDITSMSVDRLEVEPFDLADPVDEAVAMVRPLADEHEVVVATVRAQTAVPVEADRRRVRQVFINLLSNAIKYNRPGGRVDVSLGCGADGSVRVEVRDTGPGIAEVDLPRLFDPFDRLGQTSDVEGTGIGLPLCRRLVELMGGRIEVVSTPGVGSTFTVVLPAAG